MPLHLEVLEQRLELGVAELRSSRGDEHQARHEIRPGRREPSRAHTPKRGPDHGGGAIEDAVVATGGRVLASTNEAGDDGGKGERDGYVVGVFGGDDSIVLEFYVDESAAACGVRGTRRAPTRPTLAVPRFGSPLDRQLELVRAELRWLEVPVLRNRKINALVGMETPWDDFGPPPPPTMEEMYGADARRLDDPLQ